MSTYLIVDSDKKARNLLKKRLLNVEPLCEIKEAANLEDAMLFYIMHKPQLIFLEIDLKDELGFELIHGLLELGEQPRVAITTSNEKYTIRAIRSSVVDYLLKPINLEELQFCLNRARFLEEDEQDRQIMNELYVKLKINKKVRINTRVGFEVIKPEEILYCKADRNYTDICLTDGSRLTTSNTLGSVVQQLPQELFFRIGRSAVINLEYLKSVNRKERQCVLCCSNELFSLPLSPGKVSELAKVLNK